jgi:hypothetical protein
MKYEWAKKKNRLPKEDLFFTPRKNSFAQLLQLGKFSRRQKRIPQYSLVMEQLELMPRRVEIPNLK